MKQKLVLHIEVIFDQEIVKKDEDGKDFLKDICEIIIDGNPQLTKEVHGKIIEYSPNGKQKEVLAYADYKDEELKAETTTEKFCRERNLTRKDLDDMANS